MEKEVVEAVRRTPIRRRLHRHHRSEKAFRRRRHQGDEGQDLPGHLPRTLLPRLEAPHRRPHPDHRGRRRIRARRRLRARHDVRHDHRRRQRQVRPTGDHPRRDPGHGRLTAPHPRRRQGQGHGPVPDRPPDGRRGSRALRSGHPSRPDHRPARRDPEGRRHDRLHEQDNRRGRQAGRQPVLRDDPRRACSPSRTPSTRCSPPRTRPRACRRSPRSASPSGSAEPAGSRRGP